jgi:hypothetical protein
MYVRTYGALGQGVPQNGLGQCDPSPAQTMTFANILGTIECELKRNFANPNDVRLLARRRRLRELFNGVQAPRAKDLFDQLQLRNDPLAQLLRFRLATPTRQELLSILFFAEFDLRFEPQSSTSGVPANPRMTSAEKTQRIAEVNKLVPELLRRRDARAASALQGTVPPAAAAQSSLVPAATRLSTAQLELFREFFPDGAGGIQFDVFERSFEQFNNGELRDPTVPGKREPNGGFEFLFAEFAFLCIDSDIDKSNWTKALKVFVQTQEIFMHVYRSAPHRAPPRVDAPLPTCLVDAGGNRLARRPLDGPSGFDDTNFNAVGQSNGVRKAALHAKYARMSGAMLRNAARDNLLRAQCMP